MQLPLVSIIIPTFNSGKYLNRCLTSIEMQSYTELEIILIDAGSTDDTFDIIDKFKTRLKLKFLSLKKSTQSEARNLGLQNATGEYIAFCDSDDFYLPEKTSKQINLMSNTPIDVSYFDVFHFYSDQKDQLFLNRHPTDEDIIAECIANQTINLNSVMIRKNFLDQNNLLFPFGEMGRYGEDGNFIFQLAINRAKFKKLDENLSVVEVRKDSHTQWEAQWKMKYYAVKYREEAKPKLATYYLPLLEAAIKNLKFKLIISFIIAGKYQDAKQTLISLSPKKLAWFTSILFNVIRIVPHKWLNKTITTLWDKRRLKINQFYPKISDMLRVQLKQISDIR